MDVNSRRSRSMASPHGLVLRPTNLSRLMDMHMQCERISAITAYDATFASAAGRSGVDCILVDAQLANHYQGLDSREDASVAALTYHVSNVSQGLKRTQVPAWVISDLPSLGEGVKHDTVMRRAIGLYNAGAQMLRLKIDEHFSETAFFLTERGIPVCGHAKRVSKTKCRTVVQMMKESGAQLLVLEQMEDEVVVAISNALPQCITLGLHSGQATSGQLLPLHDLLGLNESGSSAKGSGYLSRAGSIGAALALFVAEVKANSTNSGGFARHRRWSESI